MQPSYCQVIASVHYAIDRLSAYAKPAAQFGITYVFFIITLRRFSCDSYFAFFIVFFLFKKVYNMSPTALMGSEANSERAKVQQFQYNDEIITLIFGNSNVILCVPLKKGHAVTFYRCGD